MIIDWNCVRETITDDKVLNLLQTIAALIGIHLAIQSTGVARQIANRDTTERSLKYKIDILLGWKTKIEQLMKEKNLSKDALKMANDDIARFQVDIARYRKELKELYESEV